MSEPMKNLSYQSFPDLIETLTRKIGAAGKVQECYGGVCIEVTNPSDFPWSDILEELLNAKEEVWVRKRDDTIEIMSKSANP